MVASPREVHLVGSVPLSSAEEVFRATSEVLGARLTKIPDGETGKRRNWINFQYATLARNPLLEFDGPPIELDSLIDESDGKGADYTFTRLRLRPGANAAELRIGKLGYAEHAIRSYEQFAALKRAGQIGPEVRFQVSLPTPLAPVAVFVAGPSMSAVYPAYAVALLAELAEIVGHIPHAELAVQWDVAVEIGLWEGMFPRPPGDWKAMLFAQFKQIGEAVPAGVALGYHLCYGDRGHKHFAEPRDTGILVEVAQGILARVGRPIDWLHVPVPHDRDDAAYFAPLAGLELPARTRLFLGLIHLRDGVRGAERRIAAAEQVVHGFGVGTECGFGRRDPATIHALLQLHAQVP